MYTGADGGKVPKAHRRRGDNCAGTVQGLQAKEMTEKPEKEQKKPKEQNHARRLKFVDEYVKDYNAKQAAIRAGYSEKGAKQVGHRLLTYVDVQAAIKRKKATAEVSTTCTVKKVIESLETIQARALELDRLADANRATELIGKHLGVFTDKIEVTTGTKPEMSAQERAEHLRSQLKLISDQEDAGTAIPGQEDVA